MNVLVRVDDVVANLPGAIDAMREYLRIYKCWTGAPPNTFALNEECLNRSYALKVRRGGPSLIL